MMLTVEPLNPADYFGQQSAIKEMQSSLLAYCVRQRVSEIVVEIEKAGSLPDDWDQQSREVLDQLCEKGEMLIYPDWKTEKQRLEIEQMFQDLCKAIAFLSFVKGGITIFGSHYIATLNDSSKT